MHPQKKLDLVFRSVTGATMISLMTLVITAVNAGFGPDFLPRWRRAFGIARVVGLPVTSFLAGVFRSRWRAN